MALDIQWDHQFCLACDRQTDGATYCSESCRLADYEKTSSASSSGASSPALPGPHHVWGFSGMSPSNASGLYLSPALDFLGSTSSSSQRSSTRSSSSQQPSASFSTRPLSPSSSHSSLSSMGSSNATRTANESFQLSEKAKRELQAYASTFEQVRLQRRRSY